MTITIGRHIKISDNYKNKKLGKEILKTLKNYFKTKIRRKWINKRFYPKCVQISIGPNTKLIGKNINDFMKRETIKEINKLCNKYNRKLIIHGSYAISLSKPPEKNMNVINTLVRELRNGVLLGAKGVIVHLGSRKIKSLNLILNENEALNNVVKNIKKVLKIYKEKYGKELKGTKLLLETPAGEGLSIASNMRNYTKLFKKLQNKSIGACIDTCHIFASGMVDMRSSKAVLEFLQNFDSKIGLNRIGCIHLNDSSREFNSHIDCHKEIGCGYIGNRKLDGSLDGIQLLLSFLKTKSNNLNIPIIMETPTGINSECISEPINSDRGITKKSENELRMIVELSDLKSIKLSKVPEVYYTLINYC